MTVRERVNQMDNKFVEQVVAYAIDEVSLQYSYDFRVPPASIVGNGISTKIGDHVAKLKAKKVFIVTDKQIVKLGLMQPMLRSLERNAIAYAVFDEVEPDPTDVVVQAGVANLSKCNCDSVIAFGGGSAIDAGKAIAVFATNPFDLSRPITEETFKNPRCPLVAVPTTAGTGSEVTDISVITNIQTHIKHPLQHSYFIPDIAVIDPKLTLGIPPKITAATGIDVLTHAIESYLARGACTLAQALSYSAMQQVGKYLRVAVGDGSNLEARHHMAVASYMAGMAFSNAGLGLCHAMAHQIGAKYKLPHGTANAIVLPEVMHFNMLVRMERLRDVAHAFEQRIENLDPKDAAYKGIEGVKELIEDVGLPTRLRDIGAQKSDFEEMAKQALQDPTLTTNPRTVRVEDIIEVFERSY
jgi:alcohol dehydrogenase class IV